MSITQQSDALAHWYATHGRHDLPWRQTRDAYAIYISEIMLQQTQVVTVRDRFYGPFLAQFPTLSHLAAAPLETVLKAWEGLGYYSRARNLHRAAQLAAPRLPETVEGLMALPGIGQNTAHAVAAFAHGVRVPVMEANVRRILHRFHAWEQATPQQLWDAATALLSEVDPFVHNQAMMDIGATLCTPRAPRCDACPLAEGCAGKTQPERYPLPKMRKAVPVRKSIIRVMQDGAGRLHLETRNSRMLGGMYGFPCEEVVSRQLPVAGTRKHADNWQLETDNYLGSLTHTYSHFRLEAEVFLCALTDASLPVYTREEIAALPLSGVDHKVLALLDGFLHSTRDALKSLPPLAGGG